MPWLVRLRGGSRSCPLIRNQSTGRPWEPGVWEDGSRGGGRRACGLSQGGAGEEKEAETGGGG